MQKHRASVYTVGFLTIIFGILFYAFTAAARGAFHFSVYSLPTFIPRVIIEVVLSYITITALAKANRSTFGFIRILTIPLLLAADLIMGYSIAGNQIFGMAIMALIIAFITLSGKFERKGLGLLLLSAALPVITLSIYKYDINHFNSVEAEQIIVLLALLVFFFMMAALKAKENPLAFLLKPVFLLQAIASGFASAVGGFAYMFASPSVITTTLRGGAVLFSTLSGDFYFKEKRPLLKFLVALGIIGGLIFLI
jgi:hypothetical protein